MVIKGEEKCKVCGNVEKWYYKPTLTHINLDTPLGPAPLDRQELDTSKTFLGGYLICSKCKNKIYVEKIK